eukprot:g6759.t1
MLQTLVVGTFSFTSRPPWVVRRLMSTGTTSCQPAPRQDKVTGLKAGVPSTIRIEVWFGSAQDQQAVAALQRNVECCLATRTLEGRLGNVPKAELKVHKLTRHQREKRRPTCPPLCIDRADGSVPGREQLRVEVDVSTEDNASLGSDAWRGLGDGSYVSWKEPDYKSLYLSKELCPGEHCTPEHPILDYDQDLPGNAMAVLQPLVSWAFRHAQSRESMRPSIREDMGQSVGRVLCGPSCFTVHTGDVVEKVDSKRVAVEHAERGESARMLLRPEAQAALGTYRREEEVNEVEQAHIKADSNLPTCYFLATSAKCTKGYEGDSQWVIELEKGWSPWMPGNEPYYGATDAPLRYTLGRYDFEVHFESETVGSQTNLTTGKAQRRPRRRPSRRNRTGSNGGAGMMPTRRCSPTLCGRSSRQSRVHYAQVDSSPNSRSTATGEGCSRWSPVVFLCFCMTLTMVLVLSINQAMHRSQLTPQNFDCEAGLAVWEVDWSGEKMDFCCVRYGVGCMNFNCEGQDSEWTDLQSRWCCEVRGLGGSCELSLPYDCTNGLDEWHTWQPLKQEWCCQHRGLACEEHQGGAEGPKLQPPHKAPGPTSAGPSRPPGPARPGSAGTAGHPSVGSRQSGQEVEPASSGGWHWSWPSWLSWWSSPKGGEENNHSSEEATSEKCRTARGRDCTLDGVVSTCKDWVQDFSRIVFNAQENSCDQASSPARSYSRTCWGALCVGCELEDAPCVKETTTLKPLTTHMLRTTLPPTTLPPTTLPPTTLPPTTLPPTTRPPTTQAVTQAVTTLPPTTRAATTSLKPVTSAPPKSTREPPLHDCNADVEQWQEKWSDAKKVWCCRNEATMCPF